MGDVRSYEKAVQESTDYFNGDNLAAKVFVDKYALRDDDGNLLETTPTDMHRRLAREFSRVECDKYGCSALSEDFIFNLLDRFKYIVPGGSIMFGAGNNTYSTLSNCYVIDSPADSYGSIMRTDEEIVQISKRRGGVGFDISSLRPEGFLTKNSARSSTGPISFANRFSNSIREVGQAGRRGACCITMSIHHPDIVKFAQCKRDRTKVTGANISIKLTDEFLNAVKENKDYEQRWPIDSDNPSVSIMVSAKDVWNAIIENAHADAEPGLLFWDTILKESVADCYKDRGFKSTGVNPCAELVLSTLDSCRLLCLNLYGFVENPFTKDAYFNHKKFFEYSRYAQRLMDDVIDLEIEAIDRIIKKIMKDRTNEDVDILNRELSIWERIRLSCKNGRRTGTGITALGDTLAALGVGYGSEDGVRITGDIYRTLKFGCYYESTQMAKQLFSFSCFDPELEKDNPFLNRMKEERIDFKDGTSITGEFLCKCMNEYGRRNIACLTTAPTGSISLLTQTTSGIEPLFMMKSTRRKKGNPDDDGFRTDFIDKTGDHWMEFDVYHEKLNTWMEITGETDINKSPWFGYCAEDIGSKQRILTQAAAQKHIDHSISSTVNLPAESTVEDIKEVYETAWDNGLKGITVYRSGSRDGVIIDKNKKTSIDTVQKYDTIDDIKRPKSLPCNIHHTSIGGKPYIVFVGLLDDKPYEVFAGINTFIPKNIESGNIVRKKKDFYTVSFNGMDEELSPITAISREMEEVVTRLTSLSLRCGANMHVVVKQLEKVGEKQELQSFARGIVRVLKKYIPDGTLEQGELCPECNAKIIRQEGCMLCVGCGWSKCI